VPCVVILSVGNDETLLRSRNAVLRTAGCVVIEAVSPKHAMAEFNGGDFDLVILCHSISPEDCERLGEAIRRRSVRTPVISVGELTFDGESSSMSVVESEPQKLLSTLSGLTGRDMRGSISTNPN
jgi:DNA-binding response OmpR family regulator